MKDLFKNKNLYFIIMPVFAAIWVLLMCTVSIPSAEDSWKQYEDEYHNSLKVIANILLLDPERLNYDAKKTTTDAFDYAAVIELFAKKHGIPSSTYKVTSSRPMRKGDVTTQSANISLQTVNVEKLASFLSSILAGWPDLQCDMLTVKKLNTGKDAWTVSMKLTYSY